MPKVGDRVIFPGLKVGGASRSGKLTKVAGSAVWVLWDDGTTTFLVPGPGAMQLENGGSAAKKSASTRKKPAAAKSGPLKTRAAKKSAPSAKKPAAKKKR